MSERAIVTAQNIRDLVDQAVALQEENARLRRFIDFTVRSWLAGETEHDGCDAAACYHARVHTEKYTKLDAVLRELVVGKEEKPCP